MSSNNNNNNVNRNKTTDIDMLNDHNYSTPLRSLSFNNNLNFYSPSNLTSQLTESISSPPVVPLTTTTTTTIPSPPVVPLTTTTTTTTISPPLNSLNFHDELELLDSMFSNINTGSIDFSNIVLFKQFLSIIILNPDTIGAMISKITSKSTEFELSKRVSNGSTVLVNTLNNLNEKKGRSRERKIQEIAEKHSIDNELNNAQIIQFLSTGNVPIIVEPTPNDFKNSTKILIAIADKVEKKDYKEEYTRNSKKPRIKESLKQSNMYMYLLSNFIGRELIYYCQIFYKTIIISIACHPQIIILLSFENEDDLGMNEDGTKSKIKFGHHLVNFAVPNYLFHYYVKTIELNKKTRESIVNFNETTTPISTIKETIPKENSIYHYRCKSIDEDILAKLKELSITNNISNIESINQDAYSHAKKYIVEGDIDNALSLVVGSLSSKANKVTMNEGSEMYEDFKKAYWGDDQSKINFINSYLGLNKKKKDKNEFNNLLNVVRDHLKILVESLKPIESRDYNIKIIGGNSIEKSLIDNIKDYKQDFKPTISIYFQYLFKLLLPASLVPPPQPIITTRIINNNLPTTSNLQST